MHHKFNHSDFLEAQYKKKLYLKMYIYLWNSNKNKIKLYESGCVIECD